MNVLTFDVETTHKEKTGGGHTPLPYFGNHLVSVGYKWLVSGVDYDCYYHHYHYHLLPLPLPLRVPPLLAPAQVLPPLLPLPRRLLLLLRLLTTTYYYYYG